MVSNLFNFYLPSISPPSDCERVPDSKVDGANMGPIWGQHDPGGPHVGPMNFAIWGDVNKFVGQIDCHRRGF